MLLICCPTGAREKEKYNDLRKGSMWREMILNESEVRWLEGLGSNAMAHYMPKPRGGKSRETQTGSQWYVVHQQV